MKKSIILSALSVVMLCACSSEKKNEYYIPKNTVEFAGNAFTAFSLGSDVKLYPVQNPERPSQWTLQAVVPVRKETAEQVNNLQINVVPLDDRGVRLRDGLALEGEDLANLVPVFNATPSAERVVVFSIADESKKYMNESEVTRLLENTKGVRMDFNLVDGATPTAVGNTPAAAGSTPAASTTGTAQNTEEFPMTLDGLCRKFGVYGLLSRYERALRNGNKKEAKRIEDQLWAIEKRVKADYNIPESLRDRFKDYVEDKEDEIEDRY